MEGVYKLKAWVSGGGKGRQGVAGKGQWVERCGSRRRPQASCDGAPGSGGTRLWACRRGRPDRGGGQGPHGP